ncbi:MAG: amino acid decarboxylase [Clostridia bacterium]|nr:amino acid decarboxylase [Clostridia bacterium]
MKTPIRDFVARYAEKSVSRLHMPGHKGRGPLGCEALDITEIAGADALYEAAGIIDESEKNAAALFGTRRTLYSTEGSSQCIRAMLYLALTARRPGRGRPLALAARNAHKAFLFAAALCDFDVQWLYPEEESASLCGCPVSAAGLAAALDALAEPPFCVYVTSPDYLGGMLDIASLSRVCRARGVPLLVDNAHGAYLRFLPEAAHPMELGADMCCDSAHKTLPVLTGGAYLHIAKAADPRYAAAAKRAMALFGSTSPSYLILQSLDCANAALAGDWPARLSACRARMDALKATLRARGFDAPGTEPMKLTLATDGPRAAALLREQGVECEYADEGHVVLMASPDNGEEDFLRVERALAAPLPHAPRAFYPPRPPRRMTIREALFAPDELLPVRAAIGRVCAAPTVSCPPAIPIAVSGEEITDEVAAAFERFGVEEISVVKES